MIENGKKYNNKKISYIMDRNIRMLKTDINNFN